MNWRNKSLNHYGWIHEQYDYPSARMWEKWGWAGLKKKRKTLLRTKVLFGHVSVSVDGARVVTPRYLPVILFKSLLVLISDFMLFLLRGGGGRWKSTLVCVQKRLTDSRVGILVQSLEPLCVH